jgi:hypothetical protein
MDPDVLADLDAIDATLAGEPVDPSYAELAELALLLAHTAPRPEPEYARELDRRVARRFEPLASAAAPDARRRPRLRLWTAGPGLAAVVAAAVAVVVISTGGFKSGSTSTTGSGVVPLGAAGNSITTSNSSTRASGAGIASRKSPSFSAPTTSAVHAQANSGSASGSGSASDYSAGAAVLTAPSVAASPVGGTSGKAIQSAQISLTTPNVHVNQVSQEVYNVVAAEHGTVQSAQSTTATNVNGGGYAEFTLSIPTANLQAAMTQLSRLHYAAVASRTDGTQNVSTQYSSDQRNLKDAQALRISLLKQLQAADSQTAIDSIEAQLRTANSQISSAQSKLGSLNHHISYSTVTVQVNSGGLPVIVNRAHHASSGFTIRRAGHDALRVLVVSVGIALITLAVLVPVGLVLGLLLWIGLALRQRRREHALDTP